jgi:hypothetical protein
MALKFQPLAGDRLVGAKSRRFLRETATCGGYLGTFGAGIGHARAWHS